MNLQRSDMMNLSATSAPRRAPAPGALFRRIGLLPLLLLVAMAISSCSPEDPFVPTVKIDSGGYKGTGAFLRVIHAVVNGPQTDVYIDTAKFFDEPQSYLGFSSAGNNGKYYPVDALASSIRFRSGGSDVASRALSLTRGEYYTAYLYGKAGGPYNVLLTTDTVFAQPTAQEKSVRYRLVNLSHDAPALDIYQDNYAPPPAVTGLSFGTASSYVSSKAYPFGNGTSLFVTEANNPQKELLKVPKLVPLPAGTTWTIIFTGVTHPSGDDPYILLSALQESFRQESDTLYGTVPFSVPLGLIRFVNLVPADTLLDVAFYNAMAEFSKNDNFRHNLEGQRDAVEFMATLGRDSSLFGRDTVGRSRYFSVGLLQTNFSYRIEIHYFAGTDIFSTDYIYRRQTPLAPLNAPTGQPFTPQANKRYTIVAYGPYIPGQARTNTLLDNTSTPPPGMTQVRLFHGAFGTEYEGKKLRLSIGGMQTPTPVTYGESTAGANSITVAGGSPEVSVIDESGATIYTQSLANTPLTPGRAYTIFLSRGPKGDGLYLHAMSEGLGQ